MLQYGSTILKHITQTILVANDSDIHNRVRCFNIEHIETHQGIMLCLGETALSNQGGHVRIVSGVFQYGLIV
jgi:hypothetical protein